MENPSNGGSYRRMADGALVPLAQPGMSEAEAAVAAKAREQLEHDRAELAKSQAAQPEAKAEDATDAGGETENSGRRGRRRE